MTEQATRIDRPFLDMDDQPRAKTLPPLPLRSDVVSAVPLRNADTNEVLRCVGQAYSLPVSALTGKCRFKNTSEGRAVAYWLLRTLGKLSFHEIGIALKKDHSSAMSGVRRCERHRSRDEAFKRFTDELAAAVRARLANP